MDDGVPELWVYRQRKNARLIIDGAVFVYAVYLAMGILLAVARITEKNSLSQMRLQRNDTCHHPQR
tara:strand:+ start:954 stop:1151 length:198 start_codon:yes stop_codon:yes gene_type:complete